jgi:hypothetical protein
MPLVHNFHCSFHEMCLRQLGPTNWRKEFTVSETTYKKEMRSILTLYRVGSAPAPINEYTVSRKRLAKHAYAATYERFRDLPGGCHCVQLHTALKLVSAMHIKAGELVWEIGCGVPTLAACMSVFTERPILCTETDKEVFLALTGTIKGLSLASSTTSDFKYKLYQDDQEWQVMHGAEWKKINADRSTRVGRIRTEEQEEAEEEEEEEEAGAGQG